MNKKTKTVLIWGVILLIFASANIIFALNLRKTQEREDQQEQVNQLQKQLAELKKQTMSNEAESEEIEPAETELENESEYTNYLLTEEFPDSFLPNAQELEEIPQEVRELLEEYYETSSIADEDVSLYVFNLNEDGTDEYLAMLWKLDGELTRGAAGNGGIPVLGSGERGIELLGVLNGNAFTVAKEKTNGYHNILVHWHMGASSGSETMYKFSENSEGKKEYQEYFKQLYDLK